MRNTLTLQQTVSMSLGLVKLLYVLWIMSGQGGRISRRKERIQTVSVPVVKTPYEIFTESENKRVRVTDDPLNGWKGFKVHRKKKDTHEWVN